MRRAVIVILANVLVLLQALSATSLRLPLRQFRFRKVEQFEI